MTLGTVGIEPRVGIRLPKRTGGLRIVVELSVVIAGWRLTATEVGAVGGRLCISGDSRRVVSLHADSEADCGRDGPLSDSVSPSFRS